MNMSISARCGICGVVDLWLYAAVDVCWLDYNNFIL